jgi:hypothetical protein
VDKLYKGELNDLNSSPSIVGVIKSRKKGWATHAAGLSEDKFLQFLCLNVREGDHME